MENTAKNYDRRNFLKTAAGVLVPAYIGLGAVGCATQSKESPGIYRGDGQIASASPEIKAFYNAEFGSVNPNPTPEQVKQAYLRHGFMEYPKELNKKSNMQWKDRKVLESILTRGGWALAVVNDAVEYPLAAIGGFVGKVVRGKKGEKGVKTFVKYFADSTIGGEGYNMMCNELVRLNGKGMIDVAYNRETTKTGGLGKIVIAGGSTALAIILPFAKNGHHHHGGSAGAGPTPSSPF